MLVEAYELMTALQTAGISPPPQHPRIRQPGWSTGPCLRVVLGSDGRVVTVTTVTEDEWDGMWTIMEGNLNSWPIVRIKKTPFSTIPAKWWRKFIAKADELLSCASHHDALRELSARFKLAAANPELMLRQVIQITARNTNLGRLATNVEINTLILGKEPDLDPKKKDSLTVQLAFIGTEGLYNNKTREAVKSVLPIQARGNRIVHSAERCAFTGQVGELQTGPFPKIPFPKLGPLPMMSMFSEAPHNTRYGQTASQTIPVGENTVLRMQDAVTWAVDKGREGKTWRGVANNRGNKDLLIAYVDGKPHLDAAVASIFGSDQEDYDRQFEVDASTVCDALNGIAKDAPESKLKLFVIRKASKASAQVTLSESITVGNVIAAARNWQEGAANVPTITVPMPKKGGGIQPRQPHTPYPDQMVRLLSREWIRAGLQANKAHGINLIEVLNLMLRKHGCWERSGIHILDLTVRRLGALFSGFFGALHSGNWDAMKGYSSRSRETILTGVSTMGIVLNAMGLRKEDYMQGTAFLVGRLLSLADTLHRQYCDKVRGSIPGQLIGNALVPVALNNPVEAIARLNQRMTIYKAWADKGQTEEEKDRNQYGLAKWAVSQMGRVCQQLSELELPAKPNKAFQAEMFLGYMAYESKKGEEDDDRN